MNEDKYRIIKSEEIDGGGNICKTQYVIQKKIFGLWVNARIRCGYRLGKLDGRISDLMLQKVIFWFSDIELAKSHLDKYLIHPIYIKYNGSIIINVPDEYSCEELFVNKSKITEYYANSPCYEYSHNLKKECEIKN